MSTRARAVAMQQAIEGLRQQAQVERKALLLQMQPAQARLAQGLKTTGTLLRALALATALAAGMRLLRRWMRPALAQAAKTEPSAGARLLHWIRLGTAAAGAIRLLSARLPP